MIGKLFVLSDGKLILNKFSIRLIDNKIVIKSVDIKDSIIKIPVHNKYNGLDYIPINFPMEMNIIEDKIFSPWIILSSESLNIDNDLDFFYNLKILLKNKYNLEFYEFNSTNIITILNQYYLENVNMSNIDDNFVSTLWLNINIIKLYCICVLIKYPNIVNKAIKDINQKENIPKKILFICNQLKLLEYELSNNYFTFNEFYNMDYYKYLSLDDLKINKYYFIVINKKINKDELLSDSPDNELSEIKTTDKIIRIKIEKISNNIISINKNKNIIFENYTWYNFHPIIKIDQNYVLYQTFNNYIFIHEIIKQYFNLSSIHIDKILEYYQKDTKLSNLVSISSIFNNISLSFDDISILKSNSYTNGFFEYITKKYSTTESIYQILEILFNNYNYPLKQNRHEIDPVFDNLLYFSIINYKLILIPIKNSTLGEILHPNVNNILPIKLRNLYTNLLKVIVQIINDEFEAIIYNQKFYNDYLHRNIIKLFLTDTNNLSITLFKSLTKGSSYEKFKNIICTNLLLIDITNKLTWSNLPKKLSYLNYFYKNEDILHYQDKINKNIIPEHFDNRIKKVIENPFEMFKYLRKEKDFIKWAKFISNKLIQLYYIPISLSSDDFGAIGKLLYLLVNINEQNNKDESYLNFINFCHSHNKLILDSSRINLKIRENFPNLKCNINLGYLAKHLTWDKETITFEEKQEKTQDVLALEVKLYSITKKYYKYKAKYLGTKDNFRLQPKNISDTSSMIQ